MYVFKKGNFNDLHLIIHAAFWQSWYGFCLALFLNTA